MGLRLRTCLTKQAIGLTEQDQKKLLDGAKQYNTGDRTQDYVLATKDLLEQMRAARAAIAAEYERKTGEQVAPAPEPTVVETPAQEQVAEKPKKNVPPKRVSKEAIEIAQTIEMVETTKSKAEYVAGISYLLGQLYGADSNDKRSARMQMLQDFLDALPKDTLFREAVREFARAEGVLTITTRNSKTKETYVNPVFQLILQAEAFDLVKKVATYKDLPAEYDTPSTIPTPEKMAREAPTEATPEVTTPPPIDTNKAAMDLAAEIRRINAYIGGTSRKAQQQKIKALEDLWAKVVEEGNEDFITENGQPLSAYFRNDSPKTAKIGNEFRIVSEEVTDEVRAQVEADLRAQRKAETGTDKTDTAEDAADYVSKSTLDDWNIFGTKDRKFDFSGRYFRDDGQPLNQKVPPGRIRMLVNQFLSKFKVKPTVHVYRSQADLKARNPELYARAAAERKNGDFDTTSAVGYSFGNGEVIIFTDRVATERQLKFVLAHETLGHFGFRAMLQAREFEAALNMVYDLSPRIRAAVELAMKSRGMSKLEAIEEYLADFAGTLDTNILARFWNAIKNALNKIGIKFEDDMARYLVSQSRAYVRNGKVDGSFVDFRKIAEQWMAIETMQDPMGSGRYFQSHETYDEYNRVAADDVLGVRNTMDVEGAQRYLRGKGINVAEGFRRLFLNLRTMNYSSRENLGFRKLYEILRDTVHTAASLRAKYNNMMAATLNAAVEIGGKVFSKGVTEAQRKTANHMLRITSRSKLRNLTDNELRRIGGLFSYEGGEPKLNTEVLAALKARGRYTLDDFRNGFEFTEFVARAMTEEERQRLRTERDEKLKDVTDEAEIKAIKDEYAGQIAADTYFAPVKVKYDPDKWGTRNLTEEDPVWKMYNEVRDTMDEAALDMLEANFAAARGERANVLRVVRNFLNRKLTDDDREFIQKIEDKYIELRGQNSTVTPEGFIKLDKAAIDRANQFIIAFNKAMLDTSENREAALRKLQKDEPSVESFFDQMEADDISASIDALKKGSDIPRKGNRQYAMQQAIQNLALFEMSKSDAELLAKRSIAGGYVPFGREGSWQVRVAAVDPTTGRVYKVEEMYRQNLLYMQMEDKAEALRTAEFVNKMFEQGNKDGTFQLKVLNDANEYVVKTVRLEARPEAARETMSASPETNLNEIIATITRYSIDITPQERERLVVGLTRQNHRARTRLERSGNPGEDPDTMKYVSQHLEALASAVARKHNRHKLDRLFDDADGDSNRLWYGSEDEYRRLEKEWKQAEKDPAVSPEAKQAAKRAFEAYHYTYRVKNSQQLGGHYKDQGQRLLAFLDAQKDVEFTDFGSGETVSQIRMWTTFAMLGASPATAILNYISLSTNALPSLAGYNPKNGFGGGFGWGAASAELTRALNLTKNNAQSDLAYWRDLLVDETGAKLARAGFTRLEAEFMYKEVASGSMQAALTNAMLGTARGKMTSGFAQKFAKGWMLPFNYSEQSARRSTGLAAYRLAFRRAIAEGKSEQDAAEIADKFAVDMIENTLGEYAMFNRPAFFRGGVAQFVFMYKMFPVNAIQMLAALDKRTQLAAIGILLLFSGLKGLPFAEDLMDIIDTIAQKLGLGPRWIWKGSAEKTLANMIDSVAPGLTPVAMRGLMNHLLPMNIADRTSLGNVVPGTGIGLAGADVGRELIEVGGPFASFMQGMVATASNVAKTALEPSEEGAITTLRKSPVTMARAFGDTWAYMNTGEIVSQKGYIVSNDLHAGVLLGRMLGFYPAAAVRENDVVRMGKRLIDYRREVASHYYGRFIMASLSGDQEAVDNVLKDVDAWNDAASGTELELSNFRASANRALREAKRTTSQRYLRTIPVNARRETQRVMDMIMTPEEREAAGN